MTELANGTLDAVTLSAKRLTVELLRAMGIKRVINVDDEHLSAPAQDLAAVVAALQSNAVELTLVARVLLDDDEDANAEELDVGEVIDLLRRSWDDLPEPRRIDLTHAAHEAASANQGSVETQSEALLGDRAALLALPELLDDSIEFITMTYGQWRSGQSILADQVPTLLLFDRSFAAEGQSERAGEELVKGVLQNEELGHVRVGLLTHTATDVGNEHEIAKIISADLGANPRPVVVVAKNRLKTDDNAFPEALRMVLFAEELQSFRQHAIDSLVAASHAETELLRDVDPYALMASFESARQEGLYETDNVTRMAKAPGIRELAVRLRKPDFISGTLSKLRNAAAVELYFTGARRPTELASLVWQERFHSSDHLRELSLPLEVGDIFRVFDLYGRGTDRFYVLLTQQCDLSVRSNGERANDSGTFVLTKLVPAPQETIGGDFLPPKGNQASIGQLDMGSESPWYVSFASRIHVPTLALDACVISSSGMSVIGVDTVAPASLSASWIARLAILRKATRGIVDKMASAESSLTVKKGQEDRAISIFEQFGAALAGGVRQGKSALTARVNVGEKTVEYGIERHSRIVGSAALGLYGLSAQHQARPAFDNDLFFEPEIGDN